MWIEREWTSSIASLARGFPAVLVTGPRQVGKTALLRRQFPKASYLTFDDPATARHAESDPADFFDNLVEPAILDEIQYVPSLFRVLKQRLVKSPKLCFMDTGLACRLVGIDDREALLRSPMAGALWETWVIGQVIRHFQASRDSSPLWFWRTSQGHEVDLVIERGGRFTIVECKLAENPDAKATVGLTAFASMYGEDVVEDAMVVCRPGRPYVLGQGPKSRAVGISELIKAISR